MERGEKLSTVFHQTASSGCGERCFWGADKLIKGSGVEAAQPSSCRCRAVQQGRHKVVYWIDERSDDLTGYKGNPNLGVQGILTIYQASPVRANATLPNHPKGGNKHQRGRNRKLYKVVFERLFLFASYVSPASNVGKSQHNYKVWKGTTGTARVKALDPGQAYRFRVHAVNCEGLAGTVSKPVVSTETLTGSRPPLH